MMKSFLPARRRRLVGLERDRPGEVARAAPERRSASRRGSRRGKRCRRSSGERRSRPRGRTPRPGTGRSPPPSRGSGCAGGGPAAAYGRSPCVRVVRGAAVFACLEAHPDLRRPRRERLSSSQLLEALDLGDNGADPRGSPHRDMVPRLEPGEERAGPADRVAGRVQRDVDDQLRARGSDEPERSAERAGDGDEVVRRGGGAAISGRRAVRRRVGMMALAISAGPAGRRRGEARGDHLEVRRAPTRSTGAQGRRGQVVGGTGGVSFVFRRAVARRCCRSCASRNL